MVNDHGSARVDRKNKIQPIIGVIKIQEQIDNDKRMREETGGQAAGMLKDTATYLHYRNLTHMDTDFILRLHATFRKASRFLVIKPRTTLPQVPSHPTHKTTGNFMAGS